MPSKIVPVIACLILSGCAVFQPVASSELSARAKQPGVTANEVASLPAGARIFVQHQAANSERLVTGTVLQASPHGIALMNCNGQLRSERGVPVLNRIPYVSRLFKVTGLGVGRIPVLWVSIRDITTVSVLEAPPLDYIAPQLQIDPNDEPYFERIGVDYNFNLPPSPSS